MTQALPYHLRCDLIIISTAKMFHVNNPNAFKPPILKARVYIHVFKSCNFHRLTEATIKSKLDEMDM
jgi:hypothetical protein